MKLLFDQNLPPRLVDSIEDEFPDPAHVHALGLGEAEDTRIWEFAKAERFVIASKDSDFAATSVLRGAPPKVIWVAGHASGDSGARSWHRVRNPAGTLSDIQAASHGYSKVLPGMIDRMPVFPAVRSME